MTTTLPPRPRFPRWAKITLGLLAAALVACGFFVAWVVVAFSGGIDDLVSGRVSADDDVVVQARERAERDLAAQAASLPSGTDPLAHASHSECEAGQHNWKIDDDYDLYCIQAEGRVLPAADIEGFRDHAMALHRSLVAGGWAADAGTAGGGPGEAGIPAVLQEYWDQRAGFPDPSYGPGDLPGVTYVRGNERLVVTWMTPAAEPSLGYPLFYAFWQTRDGKLAGDRLSSVVPAGSYAPVLTLSTEYFRQ